MKTILIVDDDKNLRRLYKVELEAEGYRVLLASDGREALVTVQDQNPDIVIMDIRMPEMDWLEAMVKLLKERGQLPVILNSAYSNYQDNFLTWAAEGYLIKSSDLQPLKQKIRDVLQSTPSAA